MRVVLVVVLVLVGVLGLAPAASAELIVNKVPDVGNFWHPLNGLPFGTYVYANSFIFQGQPGTFMDLVGVYMRNETPGTPGSMFRFEVYADNNNMPNPNAVLGVTNYLQVSNNTLALVTQSLLSPILLESGTRYWIAASTVGQPAMGSYQVGGHTQNSIYPDNGTFWYSNDPAGQNFDGQRLTPEMAIYAEGTVIPEPATLTLLGVGTLGLFGYGWRRRKSA